MIILYDLIIELGRTHRPTPNNRLAGGVFDLNCNLAPPHPWDMLKSCRGFVISKERPTSLPGFNTKRWIFSGINWKFECLTELLNQSSIFVQSCLVRNRIKKNENCIFSLEKGWQKTLESTTSRRVVSEIL